MKQFTVYDPSTGEIKWFGTCPDDAFEMQAHEGLGLIEGHYLSNLHYWDGERMVNKPPQPSSSHKWDHVTRNWRLDVEEAWSSVRRKRDKLLNACDWRMLPDTPGTQAHRNRWITYRQALRDVTNQSDPIAIVWPAPPSD